MHYYSVNFATDDLKKTHKHGTVGFRKQNRMHYAQFKQNIRAHVLPAEKKHLPITIVTAIEITKDQYEHLPEKW